MAWTNPLFLIPAMMGAICIAMGVFMRKYPPKQINDLYGYRTTRSMLSQERWDFAQQFAAKEFLKSGARLAVLSIMGLVIEVGEAAGVSLGLLIGITFMLIPFLLTERALKEQFGRVETN